MIRFESDQPVAVNVATVEELLAEIKNDPMGGWYNLPEEIDNTEVEKIKAAAEQIQAHSKYLVCIGIGGSYLGHRAVIDALGNSGPTKILYAGNNLSSREFQKMLDELGDADFSVNVISKSGTTTEPAIAFRFLKEKLKKKYSDKASEHIYVTTDSKRGALYGEAVQEKYTRFVIPDNIGGRYSVLTPVGLLPIAVAGIDIDRLLAGAFIEHRELKEKHPSDLSAVKYACSRAKLLQDGFDVEVLASFEPSLATFEEWWKQLFGESEGKNQQGIFPAATVYTTDLHSLGQYLQEGRRNIFETMLSFVKPPEVDFEIPELKQDLDQLNYLAGKKLSFVNEQARLATIEAHRAGGIPVFEVMMPDYSVESFGGLIYFFELACALSAKMTGVNPFDQPGVEAYKTAMFRLLGKTGF